MTQPIPAHGGTLHPLLEVNDSEHWMALAARSPCLTLAPRQLCDVELLMNGAFSPLTGFMDHCTYDSVVTRARLPNGLVWPMPIVLDIDSACAERLQTAKTISLQDPEGFSLAVLENPVLWKPDKKQEARQVYGTEAIQHPGVRILLQELGEYYLGGDLHGFQYPIHHDYEAYRNTPAEMRHLMKKRGWRRVMAFHTVRPIHRLQRDLTLQGAKLAKSHILLHPAAGISPTEDFHYHARARCYSALKRYYPHGLMQWFLLPLATRLAGPREALWHALIRQNFGCSHLLVGSHHASPTVSEKQEPFYPMYAAQEYLQSFEKELAIRMVAMPEHGFHPSNNRFYACGETRDDCINLSTQTLSHHLAHNLDIPTWFTFPEVYEALRKLYPPRNRRGFTLFFTGLSGSGKSTLAKILYGRLLEEGSRPVSLLDGDIVRRHLSSELSFSKKDRDTNIRRIGFVASEITKNRGVAICAPIAPYTATRKSVRRMIEENGAFIEVYVCTSLEVCEQRDRKGLYAKARQGIIPEFTGISDPYEAPEDPELYIDTDQMSPREAAEEIYLYLLREGYLDIEAFPLGLEEVS